MTRAQVVPERDWQATVIGTMEALNWSVCHVRAGMNRRGQWQTPTTSRGWPDLVALRRGWLIACECKGETTPIEPEQVAWLERFAELPCARAWVLRPTDPYDTIVRWLTDPADAPATYGWDA